MPEKKVLAIGLVFSVTVMYALTIVFIAFVLNAWGQVRGTFAYTMPHEFWEFIKWILITFGGACSFGSTIGVRMILKERKRIKEIDANAND